MRHRKDIFKLGRSSAHRSAMLANMAASLIEHGEIRTTEVKGKALRRFAEKMVTLGKKGTLHHRRQAVAKLRDKTAVKKLFDKIAPEFMERPGGYTRMVKLGQRRGDAAEVCLVKWVNDADKPTAKQAKPKAAPKPAAKEEKAAIAAAEAGAAVEPEEAKTESQEIVAEEAKTESQEIVAEEAKAESQEIVAEEAKAESQEIVADEAKAEDGAKSE